MDFGRVLTAMVTPFDKQGDVDYDTMTRLIEHLLNNGTEGLIITGTTGESPTLNNEEKISIYKHVVKIVNERIPVIAGTGTYNTLHSIELTKEAEHAGVDGIMLVTPYYNKPNQHGLYEHFATIAKATNLPIMLYDIPGRSGINLETETIVELNHIPNIVSLKDASGNLSHTATVIHSTSDEFTVYSGDDEMTLPILSIGGHGVVSVASHIIGREISEMIEAFITGDVEVAAQMHRSLLPVMTGLFLAPSPVPVKTALNIKGIHVGGVRQPLLQLSEVEKQQLKQLL
ncbi:MAG TPA: 4-hydroxy-tetrahydrodipicolinate synthase [Virgibacillus sp.]|nr:4-hydroxy-tetrahydrodipicolinate synthase [Virgibacillus sp.]